MSECQHNNFNEYFEKCDDCGMSEELIVISGLMDMLKDHPDYHGNQFIDRGYELLKKHVEETIIEE